MLHSLPLSILIVDDQRTTIILLTKLLNKIGLESIDSAPNGSDALLLLHSKRYDLVISDWHMQPIGGLQLLKTVRADEDLKRTRFIMTSVDTSVDRIMLARYSGADAYLLKPYNSSMLKSKLDAIF